MCSSVVSGKKMTWSNLNLCIKRWSFSFHVYYWPPIGICHSHGRRYFSSSSLILQYNAPIRMLKLDGICSVIFTTVLFRPQTFPSLISFHQLHSNLVNYVHNIFWRMLVTKIRLNIHLILFSHINQRIFASLWKGMIVPKYWCLMTGCLPRTSTLYILIIP